MLHCFLRSKVLPVEIWICICHNFVLGSFRASVIGYVQSSTLNRVFDALGLDLADDPVSSKPDYIAVFRRSAAAYSILLIWKKRHPPTRHWQIEQHLISQRLSVRNHLLILPLICLGGLSPSIDVGRRHIYIGSIFATRRLWMKHAGLTKTWSYCA